MTDIIDLIDQATSCQRDGCSRTLGPSPSGDFCSPRCQQRWHEERCDLFAGYESAETGDGLGDFRIRTIRAEYPPVGGSPCLAGDCRRPATGHDRCSLHRPLASCDGPPYTHTLSPASRGPSFTIVEFDTAVVRSLGGAMSAAAERLGAAAVAALDATRGLRAVLEADLLPSDPRERALELRRRRNTGPQQRPRAPRRINPRGCL